MSCDHWCSSAIFTCQSKIGASTVAGSTVQSPLLFSSGHHVSELDEMVLCQKFLKSRSDTLPYMHFTR